MGRLFVNVETHYVHASNELALHNAQGRVRHVVRRVHARVTVERKNQTRNEFARNRSLALAVRPITKASR